MLLLIAQNGADNHISGAAEHGADDLKIIWCMVQWCMIAGQDLVQRVGRAVAARSIFRSAAYCH